jgi:hypothetical protein
MAGATLGVNSYLSAPNADAAKNTGSFYAPTSTEIAEPTQAAGDEWNESIYRDFSRTLLAEANAWWVKTTTKPDGSVV